ncbi:hypothetical protein [Heyndrickxia oleronia]|uniref:hypothetical protein n=1 Tax=Heyndrickxia oleronia TaxID=38875 RepID=UPI001B122E2A|nr:hypothetical protein [Heyndrickxia oleronia]GIN39608.1 hypothetical protein J19TS1_25570 [Heyndrickxia oleronia]
MEDKPEVIKPAKIQKPIGEPTNSERRAEVKTPEALLNQAKEKARKTGKLEDIAAFSVLKQKLFGGR